MFPSLPVGPEERPAAYAAEFEVEGETYRCPLYGFLPRTLVVVREPARIAVSESIAL